MPPHPLTNFEIQKQYQNEPRFNGGYSRDNLPECSSAEIKGGTYITKLDDYSDIGTPWAALYVGRSSPNDVQNNAVTYFKFLGVEHIRKETKTFIGNKNIRKHLQNKSI